MEFERKLSNDGMSAHAYLSMCALSGPYFDRLIEAIRAAGHDVAPGKVSVMENRTFVDFGIGDVKFSASFSRWSANGLFTMTAGAHQEPYQPPIYFGFRRRGKSVALADKLAADFLARLPRHFEQCRERRRAEAMLIAAGFKLSWMQNNMFHAKNFTASVNQDGTVQLVSLSSISVEKALEIAGMQPAA